MKSTINILVNIESDYDIVGPKPLPFELVYQALVEEEDDVGADQVRFSHPMDLLYSHPHLLVEHPESYTNDPMFYTDECDPDGEIFEPYDGPSEPADLDYDCDSSSSSPSFLCLTPEEILFSIRQIERVLELLAESDLEGVEERLRCIAETLEGVPDSKAAEIARRRLLIARSLVLDDQCKEAEAIVEEASSILSGLG